MLLTWILFHHVWFLAICNLDLSIYYNFESIILFFLKVVFFFFFDFLLSVFIVFSLIVFFKKKFSQLIIEFLTELKNPI